MTESPNIYLDDPDALSVLLKRLDLSAEIYVNGDFCGTWAVDTGGSKRIPFHLIGSGNAWLHLEDSEPQPLAQHDLVIFPRDSHHILADSREKPEPQQVNAPMTNDGAVTNMICGFFEFRNPVLFPVLESLPSVVVMKSNGVETGERIGVLVDMMLRELADKHSGYYAVIDQMAFLIFVEVMRQQMEQDKLGAGLIKALFDSRLGRALNAIHQRSEFNWSLETLAQEAAMSRSNFADAFNRTVGLSPMKYLTQWRMNEARHLLQTTQLSVAQIAEKSGYESEAAFRKAYRKTLGEPPGAVRAVTD